MTLRCRLGFHTNSIWCGRCGVWRKGIHLGRHEEFWRPSAALRSEITDKLRGAMTRIPHEVTADNELPTDESSDDFASAYDDIDRWLATYSESADPSADS